MSDVSNPRHSWLTSLSTGLHRRMIPIVVSICSILIVLLALILLIVYSIRRIKGTTRVLVIADNDLFIDEYCLGKRHTYGRTSHIDPDEHKWNKVHWQCDKAYISDFLLSDVIFRWIIAVESTNIRTFIYKDVSTYVDEHCRNEWSYLLEFIFEETWQQERQQKNTGKVRHLNRSVLVSFVSGEQSVVVISHLCSCRTMLIFYCCVCLCVSVCVCVYPPECMNQIKTMLFQLTHSIEKDFKSFVVLMFFSDSSW
jgi:hypothetical protein